MVYENTMYAAIFAAVGAVICLILIALRWYKTRGRGKEPFDEKSKVLSGEGAIHGYDIDQKDSLDEHLDVLTKKLAEKEGRLRISKSKIRETQNEIANLPAIDQDVRCKYKEVMESLKLDLFSNEKECRKLQEQIEWVSLKRAELKDEVRRGQRLYGVAAAELADNLAELQRGRNDNVAEKHHYSDCSATLKHRKDPLLPRIPMTAPLIKSPSTQTPSPPLFSQFDY